MKSLTFRLALAVACAVVASAASAELATGRVTKIGCHNTDDECWVTLSGFTQSQYCNQFYELRWSASTSWGNRWYAMLMAASVSGQVVTLAVSANTCSVQGYPTFEWGYVVG